MDNCEENGGAAALVDQEKRCPQCDFINLAEAELCISCAQELLPKVETKKHLLHRRTNLSCRFCTTIITEDCRICPMCSKSQDLPKDGSLKEKHVVENKSYLADDRHTLHCKFCTSEIQEGSRICPVCSKSQDLPEEGAQRKDTDDWLTDDEDQCAECTYKTKASTCEMCGNQLRSAYVELNSMTERETSHTQPSHNEDQLEQDENKGLLGGVVTFCKKARINVYDDPCLIWL